MYTNNFTPIREYSYTVTKKDVNKNKVLLPNVLYNTMESTAINSLASIKDALHVDQHLFKLHILKNAYLKDSLKLTPKIQKLNREEVLLHIYVYKEIKNELEIICEATFGFKFKENVSLNIAS
ncbi:hypothetical protein [Flavicella sediminum]|uniref:hypothetical protein n=1 Tax=Flavicella sediminum TaxID=2585141 RepID=UPI00111D212C|nr:hypothetical protein [Flavicella sediminum]